MKRILFGVLLSALGSCAVYAADPVDPVKQYAQLLHHGAFMCRTEQGTYDHAVRYQSATQDAQREKVMACYAEFSEKAKAGLPGALKAAKNESVKTALKTLYTDWRSYFGEFDRISESRYERSEDALYTELLIQ